jgi:hypothetical protein
MEEIDGRERFAQMTPEQLAAEIQVRHKLSSLHIFAESGAWRVFGAREQPGNFQASVEEGRGIDIASAIKNLEERLIAGPLNRAPWN